MKQPTTAIPVDFQRWERWLLALLLAVCLVLAVQGKGREERLAYERFLGVAPQVQEALEQFAADHQGAFPPDQMFTRAPEGLTDRYIDWQEDWKLDYEVHPNGHGGQYVCLEFCGPYKQRQYFGLCENPQIRQRFGRGEPIPDQTNRIWLIREQALILPKAPPPPPPPPPPEPEP